MAMPQETAGGCSPTPRKDRVASAAMYAPEVDGGDHDHRGEELGRMWEKMIRVGVAPSARAAWT